MYEKKIGYIGLGDMGAGIASTLLKKGFDLTAYDLRPEAIEAMVKKGAQGAGSMKELVEAVDHIYICVVDDAGVVKVITGEDGILKYSKPGQVIVVQSTCKMKTIEEVAAAAEAKGVGLLDCPVSGSNDDRYNGNLAVYVGGKKEYYEECIDALNATGANGDKVIYFGLSGCGQLGKLMNNLTNLPTLTCMQQAFMLGAAYGLTEETILKIIENGSTGVCWYVEHYPFFDDLRKGHISGPAIGRMGKKDLYAARNAALAHGVGLPVVDIYGTCEELSGCERMEYLLQRDGDFSYPVEQMASLLINNE